mgnify:CR=1 FL=1
MNLVGFVPVYLGVLARRSTHWATSHHGDSAAKSPLHLAARTSVFINQLTFLVYHYYRLQFATDRLWVATVVIIWPISSTYRCICIIFAHSCARYFYFAFARWQRLWSNAHRAAVDAFSQKSGSTAFSTKSSLRYFLFRPNCNRLHPLGLALSPYNLVIIAAAIPEIWGLMTFKKVSINQKIECY